MFNWMKETLGLVLPTVANAQQNEKNYLVSKQREALDQKTIKLVDKYIDIENERFIITDEELLKQKLTEEEFNSVKDAMKMVNESVANNKNDITDINKDLEL